jgi:hypothetical protein
VAPLLWTGGVGYSLRHVRLSFEPIMAKAYRSYPGHVVIRVAPGGNQYDVFVLNDTDTRSGVIKHFGPYH